MKPPRRMRRMRALDGTEHDELPDGTFRRRIDPSAREQHPKPLDIVEAERKHGGLLEVDPNGDKRIHLCPGSCGGRVRTVRGYACAKCWYRLPKELRVVIALNHGKKLMRTELTTAMRDARLWFQQNPPPKEAAGG